MAVEADRKGELPPEEAVALGTWQLKQAALKIKRKRDKQGHYLVAKTGFVERGTNRATKLSQAQEELRLHKHWKLWDGLLWLVGCGSATDLKHWVGQPDQFVENRQETAITASDQIPVWLKPDAGKVLQPRSVQQAAQKAQKRRKVVRAGGAAEGGEKGLQHEYNHPRGPGDSGAARWRVSFVARQAVENFFSNILEPVGYQRKIKLKGENIDREQFIIYNII